MTGWVSGLAHTIWTGTDATLSSWVAGVGHTIWMVIEGSLVPNSISCVATQYVYVEISASQPNGTIIDPTSDAVSFAFLTTSTAPVAATTWYTASWAAGTPYTAQCLVGPNGGVVTLNANSTPYSVWVRINDNPETAIVFGGKLGAT